jgi:hypothetical protein
MCDAAGHYGVCQVVAEPGLTLRWARYAVVPGSPVCRACFDALIPIRRVFPPPARARATSVR